MKKSNRTLLQYFQFVLGHPKTGTSLLQYLLALDTKRFAICDKFMIGFPHCFLWFEFIGKFIFKGYSPATL